MSRRRNLRCKALKPRGRGIRQESLFQPPVSKATELRRSGFKSRKSKAARKAALWRYVCLGSRGEIIIPRHARAVTAGTMEVRKQNSVKTFLRNHRRAREPNNSRSDPSVHKTERTGNRNHRFRGVSASADLRQLAFAYLVYPGATHTRFEHSLGVCHVAGLLARKLGFDEDQTKLVRLAALLHDLGHGPFSHVSEEALERYSDRDKLPPKTHKIHELITTILIREDPQIARSLAQNDREKIVNALGPGHGEPILKHVLSGPLDADKQDYLLRDSYYCGVQYGMFDLPQLHEVLCNIADPAGDRTLMISPTASIR